MQLDILNKHKENLYSRIESLSQIQIFYSLYILRHDAVNLLYFKLILLDLTEFLV